VRIFLDANILFSAADPGSATRTLLEALGQVGHGLVTSDLAVTEAERNLTLKRPRHREGLRDVLAGVTVAGTPRDAGPVDIEPKDRPQVAAAMAAGCVAFWTGDTRHFGHLFGRTRHGLAFVSGAMLARTHLPRD
jgi:hypothetical protein